MPTWSFDMHARIDKGDARSGASGLISARLLSRQAYHLGIITDEVDEDRGLTFVLQATHEYGNVSCAAAHE